MTKITLKEANTSDIAELARIFDQYRAFYNKASDIQGAVAFLAKRLEEGSSQIIVALANGQIVGFTQLYPTFSSLGMSKSLILNDLFVVQEYRKHGVGSHLLKAASEYALREGFTALTLQTAVHNTQARSVYIKNGWILDTEYVYYNMIPAPSFGA